MLYGGHIFRMFSQGTRMPNYGSSGRHARPLCFQQLGHIIAAIQNSSGSMSSLLSADSHLSPVRFHLDSLVCLEVQRIQDQSQSRWGQAFSYQREGGGGVISETHPPRILKTFLVGKNEIVNRGPTKPIQKMAKRHSPPPRVGRPLSKGLAGVSVVRSRGGVFAQRAHSANYYGDYPGDNPENHAPAESCTINSKLKNSNI